MLIAILLHLKQTITCLVGREKNKIKDPGKNIVYRALKSAEIKKVLWLGIGGMFLVLLKPGDLNLTFRHAFRSTLCIRVEDSMYCFKVFCEGREKEGS